MLVEYQLSIHLSLALRAESHSSEFINALAWLGLVGRVALHADEMIAGNWQDATTTLTAMGNDNALETGIDTIARSATVTKSVIETSTGMVSPGEFKS